MVGFTLDLGFDQGNERTKVAHMTMQGAYKEVEDSSMISAIDADEFSRFMAGTRVSDEKIASNSIIATFQGKTYALGNIAMEQKRNATTGIGNRRRYYHDNALVSLLSYASVIMSQNYPSITTLNLSAVTSVPIQTYDQEIIDEIKNKFNGTHSIIYNDIPYTYTVNIPEVLMEGTGGAITYGQKTGRYALVDGGRLTHNIMIFDGTNAIIERCHTLEIGVQNIADKIKSLFYKAHHKKLTHKELEEILWAYANNKPMPSIYIQIGVERTPVLPLLLEGYVKQAITEVGQDLASLITEKWSDETGNVASDISKTIYVGGAAFYLKNHVQQLLGTTEVPPFSQRANARGNAARALAIRLKSESKIRV